MKKLFLLIMLFLVSSIYCQIKLSGDARVRPRYDINDRTESGGKKTTDFYYMYRARLKVTADIGDGWAFNSMISHNGIYYYSTFNTGDFPDILGADQSTSKPSTRESSRRASLSFMELYFGKEVEDYGFKMGLMPLGSISNPIYDLHYYPNKMVDIPYAIFNTDAAFAFSGYVNTGVGKFGAKVIVEDAKGKEEESSTGEVLSDRNDQYTLEVNYTNTVSNFIISPMALISISSEKDSVCTPNTFGINIYSPKVSNLIFQGTFAYLTQGNDKLKAIQEPGYPVSKFDAYLIRFKVSGQLGIGNLLAWVDFAKMTEKLSTVDNKYDFFFTWVGYEIPIYKSDKGAFSITPEIRYANFKKNSNKTSDRLKAEMNFDIKF